MPLTILANYRFVTYCKAGDQYGVNVHYFTPTATLGAGVPEAEFADLLFLDYDGKYANLMSTAATFAGLTIQNISSVPNPLPVGSSIAAVNGTNAGDILPRQVSGIWTKKTNFAGRANRGRMYVPFPSESSSDADGKPTAAYMLDLATLAGDLVNTRNITNGGGNGYTIKYMLRHHNGTFHDLTAYQTRQKWATQRRRGVYGGVYSGPF